ncbi:hypothetical protein ED733_002291 [Metarhizium rileyi]|uniref:GPI anchored serine-rich protein n=1 Tax=Metarhizium rileyi (strain RCEF 4871) TaxID=1649241 RepID=A0A5C6G6U1_METRR|nr:hypothetical protein ED733_002291 [Metarhizium rileyi]
MYPTALLTLLAVGAAVVSATLSTVTLTDTTTQVLTITLCGPSVTGCPVSKKTSPVFIPTPISSPVITSNTTRRIASSSTRSIASNTTSKAFYKSVAKASVTPHPLSSTFNPASNTTIPTIPTRAPTLPGSPTGTVVSTAAANGLYVQTGAVAAVVAAVIAMVY